MVTLITISTTKTRISSGNYECNYYNWGQHFNNGYNNRRSVAQAGKAPSKARGGQHTARGPNLSRQAKMSGPQRVFKLLIN